MERLIETGGLLQCHQCCIVPSSWKTRLSIHLMWVPNVTFGYSDKTVQISFL